MITFVTLPAMLLTATIVAVAFDAVVEWARRTRPLPRRSVLRLESGAA